MDDNQFDWGEFDYEVEVESAPAPEQVINDDNGQFDWGNFAYEVEGPVSEPVVETNNNDQTAEQLVNAASAPDGEGFDAGNIVKGLGSRAMTLAGNLAGFAETAGENLEKNNPLGGIAWKEGEYLPSYLDPEEYKKFKQDNENSQILRKVQKGFNTTDFGYKAGTTWDQVKKADGFWSTAAELAPFALETGLVSLPDMAAAVINPPLYFTSRSEEIAQSRAKNDGRKTAGASDLAVGSTTALIVTAMEKFGAERVFNSFIKGGDAPSKILKAAVGEGGTEFFQEQVEYAGESVNTKKGFTVNESIDRGLQGMAGGVAMGTTIATAGSGYSAATKPHIEKEVKSVEENANAINDALDKKRAQAPVVDELNPMPLSTEAQGEIQANIENEQGVAFDPETGEIFNNALSDAQIYGMDEQSANEYAKNAANNALMEQAQDIANNRETDGVGLEFEEYGDIDNEFDARVFELAETLEQLEPSIADEVLQRAELQNAPTNEIINELEGLINERSKFSAELSENSQPLQQPQGPRIEAEVSQQQAIASEPEQQQSEIVLNAVDLSGDDKLSINANGTNKLAEHTVDQEVAIELFSSLYFTDSGTPYKTEKGAHRAMKNLGIDTEVVKYEEGYGIRRPDYFKKKEATVANDAPVKEEIEPSANSGQFDPTHELSDGTQVIAVPDEDNIWQDINGEEIEDGSATSLVSKTNDDLNIKKPDSNVDNEQSSDVEKLIVDAEKKGVVLSDNDKFAIREYMESSVDLQAKANGTGNRDPLGKGDQFPMGVGFMKMTKRKEQAIDKSVTDAGKAVALWKRAEAAEKSALSLLEGKGTELDVKEKADKKANAHKELAVKAISWKKGDSFGPAEIVRVSKDRDGYPATVTIEGDGIIKGVTDKVSIVRELFSNDKENYRKLIDDARQNNQDVATNEEAASKSTAPEHKNIGVDDKELNQIVDEFNAAQQDMLNDDFQEHHLFDAPKKDEIFRLQHKVKVYNEKNGWMTVDDAKTEIEKWKDHVTKQGKEYRSENNDKIVLSLFDLSGKWSEPWAEAGYQVYQFDIQDGWGDINHQGKDINPGDINNFSTEFFNDLFGSFDGLDIHAVLAACPCTDFANSGARHFAAKDVDGRTVASVELVHQALATIEYFKPAVWAIENPVGRIERLGGLPPWRLSFDPNHLGDPYTKKTLLWGRFNADLPIAPVEPTEGSKMHTQYGGKSLKTKNARSVTPEGFAYGFFMANNAIDHPEMTLSNKYDRLDSKLIGDAIKANIDEGQIDEAVEDHYYMDLDDDAANDAIRDLLKTSDNAYVLNTEGSDVFGVVDDEIEEVSDGRYLSAPIKLKQGVPGADGFGSAHIAPKRLEDFKEVGYADEIEFLEDVAKNHTDIYEQTNGRLLLVKKNGRKKYSVVELDKEDGNDFYSVTTMFLEDKKPKGKAYEDRGKRKLLLHVAHATNSDQSVLFPSKSDDGQESTSRRSSENNDLNIDQEGENSNEKQSKTEEAPAKTKAIEEKSSDKPALKPDITGHLRASMQFDEGEFTSLNDITLKLDTGDNIISDSAANWLSRIDDRLEQINELRGCMR